MKTTLRKEILTHINTLTSEITVGEDMLELYKNSNSFALALQEESKLNEKKLNKETLLDITNIDAKDDSIEFAIWLQDNYSQNRTQGGLAMLPKGYMREDFTDNNFPISELHKIYNSK